MTDGKRQGKVLLTTTRRQACDDKVEFQTNSAGTVNPLRFLPLNRIPLSPLLCIIFIPFNTCNLPYAAIIVVSFIQVSNLRNYGLKLITCVFPWKDSARETLFTGRRNAGENLSLLWSVSLLFQKEVAFHRRKSQIFEVA